MSATIVTPKIIIPRLGLEPIVMKPRRAQLHLTEFGVDFAREEFMRQRQMKYGGRRLAPIGGGSGTMSAWFAQQCLNYGNGSTLATNPLTPYLAFLTAVPTASSTGSTITEATYTGYARTSVPSANWSAASGAAPSTSSNSNVLTGPAVTSGTSTLVSMCSCTASSAGNVIFWCSTATTVVSTTQTPPTVNTGGFAEQLT